MTTARPGRVRSEAARLAILEATRDELAERGYDRLSLDRIAAAAGVGKATIYRWYPGKGALVAEGMVSGHLLPRVVVPDTGDVRGDVTSWLLATAESLTDAATGGLIRATIAATAEDADVARHYDDHVTSVVRAELVTRLESAQRAGQVGSATPLEALVETLVGVVLLGVLTRRAPDASGLAATVTLLFEGAGVPGPAPAEAGPAPAADTAPPPVSDGRTA